MKINLIDEECGFVIEKINHIIGPNSGGKTRLCNLLSEGFSGKKPKKFLLDGNQIEKSMYSIFYIKDYDNMDLEKSMTSKSIIKHLISLETDGMDDIQKLAIQEKSDYLIKEIKNTILDKVSNDHLTINISLPLHELINKHVELFVNNQSLSIMSSSQKRIAYYDFIFEQVIKDPKPVILIIDEYDMGLSKSNVLIVEKKLQNLVAKQDVVIFISSSNMSNACYHKIYCKEKFISHELLTQDQLIEIIANEEKETIEDIREYWDDGEVVSYCKTHNIYEKNIKKFLNNEL